ncbi:MAG: hypothetical protein E7426_02415 [Ruminococcaceae bacterium]|nr:hypothetical protein [Oscillospiraceae bacterium]
MKRLPLPLVRWIMAGTLVLALIVAVVPPRSTGQIVAALVLIAAAEGFGYAFLRCPHCGCHLGWRLRMDLKRSDRCPFCGKRLEG